MFLSMFLPPRSDALASFMRHSTPCDHEEGSRQQANFSKTLKQEQTIGYLMMTVIANPNPLV